MRISTLRNVGGSVMVAIPKALLEGLGLAANAKVGLSVEAGRLVLEPRPKLRYALEDLIAQCDATAETSEESLAWERDAPVGREAL